MDRDSDTTTRTHTASCVCGQLSVTVLGEPVRVSVCHCFACQQRTGSAFGVQARFRLTQVRDRRGNSTAFTRKGDSGSHVTFRFCPACGTTVFWELDTLPEYVSVAVGTFADPTFPAPKVSVYEARRHPWVSIADDGTVEHFD